MNYEKESIKAFLLQEKLIAFLNENKTGIFHDDVTAVMGFVMIVYKEFLPLFAEFSAEESFHAYEKNSQFVVEKRMKGLKILMEKHLEEFHFLTKDWGKEKELLSLGDQLLVCIEEIFPSNSGIRGE